MSGSSETKALCGSSAWLHTDSVNFSGVALKLMHVYATYAGCGSSFVTTSALVGGELILRLYCFADVSQLMMLSQCLITKEALSKASVELRPSVGNIHPLYM